MPNMENWLTQAFPDKPVGQERLDLLQGNIMAQILSQPVDFLNERLLAKRRRWGLVFAGSWLGLGLAILLLMLLKGQLLLAWLGPTLSSFYLAFVQFGLGWLNLWQDIKVFADLKVPLLILWQEYSWQMMGMVVVVAVFVYGLRSKTPLIQPEEVE